MQTLQTLNINIFALLILIIIYFNARRGCQRVFLQNRLFLYLVYVNMALVIMDVLGWEFNLYPGAVNLVLNTAFNTLLYVCIPAAPAMWIIYADYHVNKSERRIRKLSAILLATMGANAVISLLSIRFNLYFYISADNVYSRGPYFLVFIGYIFLLLFYSLLFIVRSRKQLGSLHFFSLLQFFIPPVVGIVLQTLMYGTSYNWAGMALSLLIAYFYIQDRDLNTDYLTGVYNRRELDSYIQMKIRNSARPFAAIMLDIDTFKRINDEFGHETGDQALRDTVSILKKNLRPCDFLARYGGDEFVVLLNIDDREKLRHVMRRISASVDAFHAEVRRPYSISLSMGGDVYDASAQMTAAEFFKHIDDLMYENKRANTAALPGCGAGDD
jgi:diguanylate cyclase (GGDEF)-like protein